MLFCLPLSKVWVFQLNASAYTLHVGDTAAIPWEFRAVSDCPYACFLQKNKKDALCFRSSDEAVVTVDPQGQLLITGAGSATVTASVGDQTQTLSVTAFPAAEELVFSEEEYTLNCGEELSTVTRTEPEDAVLFSALRFSSSDEKIVTVDENGRLSALRPGTAELLVTADGVTGRATVKVKRPMTGIFFRGLPTTGARVTVERGSTRLFSIRFSPADTTDTRLVTYSFSDPSLGSIDREGVFTAEETGELLLTARCGRLTAEVLIDIQASLQGIEADGSCELSYPASKQLSWKPVPEDTTTELTVSWASDNPDVVTVDQEGRVTAVRGGTANVILRVNEFEKVIPVTVTVPVTGMRISAGSIFLYTGSSCGLSASLVPSFTTEDKTITWSSDNPGVAAVNAAGGVTAVSPGVTVIRAHHGAFSVACRVEVADMPGWEERADAIIAFGKQFLGTPYVYGGESLTGGIDCSSFTQQCFASQRISLYRTSYTQVNQGIAVSTDPSAWRKGDLIFYSPNGSVSHVAIYIGDGQILHSCQSQGGVVITAYNYNGLTPSHVRRLF